MAEIVNNVLLSAKYHDILSLIKGFRNGIVYGAKIRFAHALVVTFLFRGGPLLSQARAVWEATYTHSRNLATFVLSYKALTLLFRQLDGAKTREYHSLIAAFIGGFLVFGKYNKVNEQINLYLLSRVLYGLAKLAVDKGYIPRPKSDVFPWFAAIIWAIVLWMFEHHGNSLQPSLRSSMTYLYHDSNYWTSIRDFLVYNQ